VFNPVQIVLQELIGDADVGNVVEIWGDQLLLQVKRRNAGRLCVAKRSIGPERIERSLQG